MKYGTDVEFIGMAGRADQADIEAFISNLSVGAFPHTVDDDGTIWERFGIRSQPSFVFLNDDGTTTLHNGALGVAGLSEAIEKLQNS